MLAHSLAPPFVHFKLIMALSFLALTLTLSYPGMALPFVCHVHTPHSTNGKAKRAIRTINDTMCTLMFHAHLPSEFWAEALSTATYLLNRCPCKAINLLCHIHVFMVVLPPTPLYVFFAIFVFLTSLRQLYTNSVPVPSPASFLDIHPTIAGFGATIPTLAES
jgi:hypothetical protein